MRCVTGVFSCLYNGTQFYFRKGVLTQRCRVRSGGPVKPIRRVLDTKYRNAFYVFIKNFAVAFKRRLFLRFLVVAIQ